jgi:hypothetical protein
LEKNKAILGKSSKHEAVVGERQIVSNLTVLGQVDGVLEKISHPNEKIKTIQGIYKNSIKIGQKMGKYL